MKHLGVKTLAFSYFAASQGIIVDHLEVKSIPSSGLKFQSRGKTVIKLVDVAVGPLQLDPLKGLDIIQGITDQVDAPDTMIITRLSHKMGLVGVQGIGKLFHDDLGPFILYHPQAIEQLFKSIHMGIGGAESVIKVLEQTLVQGKKVPLPFEFLHRIAFL